MVLVKDIIKEGFIDSEIYNILPDEEKKKYIPPMSHPWKLASFKQQMKKAHTERVYA